MIEIELNRRVHALDMAMFIATTDVAKLGRTSLNPWALTVALRDLRRALAAFQRREPLPEPEFPQIEELNRLAYPEGQNVGLEGVRRWLMDRGVM